MNSMIEEMKKAIDKVKECASPFDKSLFHQSFLGLNVIEQKPQFEQKIKLNEVGIYVDGEYVDLISKETRDKFNKFLLDTFGVRDVSLMPRGKAYVFGGMVVMRSEDVIKMNSVA